MLRIIGGICLALFVAFSVVVVLTAADNADQQYKHKKEARLDSVYTSRHVQDSLRISALEKKLATVKP